MNSPSQTGALIAIIAAALLSFSSLPAEGEPPLEFEWVRSEGDTSYSGVHSLAVDTNGNLYVTGSVIGTADLWGQISQPVGPGYELFVCKLDPEGQAIWARRAGSSNSPNITLTGWSVDTDSNGCTYVAATVSVPGTNSGTETIHFGDGISVDLTNTGFGLLVAKYDGAGNCLWARDTGGSAGGFGHALKTVGAGNVLVTAHSYSNRFFLLQLDGAGNEVWRKGQAGGLVSANDVAIDSAGCCYVVGTFDYTPTVDGLTMTNRSGYPRWNTFILKFAPDGTALWAKSPDSSLGDRALTVTVDHADNVFVGGEFFRTTTWGTNVLNGVMNSIGYGTSYVLKLNPDGEVLNAWSPIQQLDRADTGDYVYGIAFDAAGGIVLVGGFEGSILFGGTTNTSYYRRDLYVAKVDAAGSPRWFIRAGAGDYDWPAARMFFRGDRLYLAGRHAPGAQFGSFVFPSAGAFVARMAYPPPLLDIAASGENVLLSWPTLPTGFHLEYADSLSPSAVWLSNSAIAMVADGSNFVTRPMTNERQFFRLRRP